MASLQRALGSENSSTSDQRQLAITANMAQHRAEHEDASQADDNHLIIFLAWEQRVLRLVLHRVTDREHSGGSNRSDGDRLEEGRVLFAAVDPVFKTLAHPY